jgi:hypothetical protein
MAGKSTATANNCRCYGVFIKHSSTTFLHRAPEHINVYSATQETNENETFELKTNETDDFQISTGDGLLKAIRSLFRAPFCVS